jgi:hypothetical protein
MTPDLLIVPIALLFASQIVVLSFYMPMSWQKYHALLFKRYPRQDYPRLHPLPREELERKFAIFRPMHLIIGVTAALALLGALILGADPRRLAGLMPICLLLQALPLYVALPLVFRIQKGLSDMPPPSPRSVELRKWRVADFVSPLWIVLGFAVQTLSLACAVAVYLYLPGTPGIFFNGVASGAMLLVLGYALSGHWYALAKRADPFMSQADTFRFRQQGYRGLFIGAAGLGAWLTFTLLRNARLVDLDVAYAVAISVVFQLSALDLVSRWNRDLDTRDFSVYRSDGSAQVAQ